MRRIAAACLLGAALVLAASCGSGSSTTTPRTQTGTINLTSANSSAGSGNLEAEVVSFLFQPDGAGPAETGSSTGTRTLTWSDAIMWARCSGDSQSCHWYSGSAPRCLRAGRRVQVAWVETRPAGDAPGQQLLAWMKCLGS
jgi:hypothetical protein